MGQSPTKITNQWADSPFRLIDTPRKNSKIPVKDETGAFAAAAEMVLVHNVFIRGLNSIYLQAPNIKLQKDIDDFATYMHSWSMILHEHHELEESWLFPWLEKAIGIPGFMERNVDQHKAFTPGLQAYDDFVKNLKEGKAKYDGAKICSIIDTFGPILTKHLDEEIGTFLELEQYAEKINWKLFNKKVEEIARKQVDKDHIVPFCIRNIDSTFEGGIHAGIWPPFPWFINLMFRFIYIPKHEEAWRFSSCDSKMRPKDLPFV